MVSVTNSIDFILQVQTHLQFIKEDIGAVERCRMDLYRARDRYSVKLRMLGADDSISGARKQWHSSPDNNTAALSGRGGMSSWNLPRRDALSASDSQYLTQTGLAVARKKRVHAQVSDSPVMIIDYFCTLCASIL